MIYHKLRSNCTYVITSCVHVRNLHLGANLHTGANLLHRICTTYKGGANSHPGANLHPGVFSSNTVYMTKIHPRCKYTPRVYICTGVYIVHMNEALENSVGPDLIPQYAVFHVCRHCLPKYLFTGIQMKRVKVLTRYI